MITRPPSNKMLDGRVIVNKRRKRSYKTKLTKTQKKLLAQLVKGK